MADQSEVVKFIREEVKDWDDDVICSARFKAFSGQRSDWEPRFQFWRDLIIKICQRFNVVFASQSEMKNCWFNREGLSPLCLDDVLLEMHKTGEIMRVAELEDARRGYIFGVVKKLMLFSFGSTTNLNDDDRFIVYRMLESKAVSVVNEFSETSWTSSCVVTMKDFESRFDDRSEACAVLSYLSKKGKARYISVRSKEGLIEGVKVSLCSNVCSSIPSIDSTVLRLVWTLEELRRQHSVIDERDKRVRMSALAALKCGDKKLALRNARQLKLASESREKVATLSNRVEEVLRVIADAESAKKVSEAIQLGAQAIKENKLEVEEVHSCLQELDELMDSQQQIYSAFESSSYAAVEDEDVEDELKKLESQIAEENPVVSTQEDTLGNAEADSLCASMVDLKLESRTENSVALGDQSSSMLEAA